MLLVWRTFAGQRPRQSARLLANDGAEIAVNTKLWNGKLRPFHVGLDTFTTVKAGPIKAVFNYRYDVGVNAWLHWATDVDVATSPLALDGNARLYFTGDGRPKITDKTIAANIVRPVAASASSGQPVFTIVGPIKGFLAGDTVSLSYGAGVFQAATILTAVNGSPNSTITLTTNLTNSLDTADTVRNTAQRFPLGSFDLGVPAPAVKLTTTPTALKSGNIEDVFDIEVTRIRSMDSGDNVVADTSGIALGATTFSFVGATFPDAVFIVGDKLGHGVFPATPFGTVTDVDVVGADVVVTFDPPFPIDLVFALVTNLSRGFVFSQETLTPTSLADLIAATQKVFAAERETGAEAIQIDVDSEFSLTVSPGMISRYTGGPAADGMIRFTHFIRRESDQAVIYQDPHIIQIKGGQVTTPSAEGKNFKATVIDTPPESGGSSYTVGTLVDRAELLFDPGPTINGGGIFVTHDIRVRRAGRVRLVLESAMHGLIVNDRITLDLSPVGQDLTAINLDGKQVKVTAVSGDTITAEGQIGGRYAPGGTYVQVFQDDEVTPRTYVYTYVVTIGGQEMEGGPSPPSDVADAGFNQSVLVSGFVNPNTTDYDTNFTAIRLYRFQEGDDGAGAFLFHSELAVNTGDITDTTLGDDLLEPLSTTGYLPPPADLQGLIELPNGLVAGFSGKELLYPVPYQLHAWPVSGRKAVHDTIVGIGAFGNSVAVVTAGIPQIFTGEDPESVSPERIELVEPCASKRGTVDMGYGVAYPGPRGLVLVSIGRAEIVTEDMFTEDEWRELNPPSFVACRFGDRYLCFYDTGGTVPSFTEHSKAGFIIDPKSDRGRLVFLDFWASEAWSDPDDGRTYIVQDGIVREFDRGELEHEYVWRSKPVVLPFDAEMSIMRIEAKVYPVRVTVLTEEGEGTTRMVARYSRVRHTGEDFRLFPGLYRRWQVEVRSVHEIEGIYMASEPDELRRYAAGQ